MKILPVRIYQQLRNNDKRNNLTQACHIKHDFISFSAMKKSRFHGVDSVVIEKFKAPLSKFNSHDDFQEWAKKETENVLRRNIVRNESNNSAQEINQGRKNLLKEWKEYLYGERDVYKNSMILLILSGILQDILPSNNHYPPELHKGVLANVIMTINDNANKSNWSIFNFASMYKKQLAETFLENEKKEKGKNITKWIIIPSKEHDKTNFEQNVKKLRTLSPTTWCTSSYTAEQYLKEGDFHIYLDKSKPVVGIRFIGDEIVEIQGEKNNARVPAKYFLMVKDYIQGKKLEKKEQKRFEKSEEIFYEIEKIKRTLGDAIKENDFEKIMNLAKIKFKKLPDGLYEINEYRQPNTLITFADLGINENELMKKIKKISGDAIFKYSKVTNLGSVEKIDGNASFTTSNVTNLGKLKSIGKNAQFSTTRIKSLANLERINGIADFSYDKSIKDLGKLSYIGGDAIFAESEVESLNNLEFIGGNLNLVSSKISDLGKLKHIEKNANLSTAGKLKTLGKLEYVGGNLEISDVKSLTSRGNLSYVGGAFTYINTSLPE